MVIIRSIRDIESKSNKAKTPRNHLFFICKQQIIPIKNFKFLIGIRVSTV